MPEPVIQAVINEMVAQMILFIESTPLDDDQRLALSSALDRSTD